MTDVLLALIGALTGGGLTSAIFWRSSRRRAEGEADSAAVAPLKDANEILRVQLQESDTRNDVLEGRVEELTAQKDELYKQLIESREQNATIKQLLCVHGACYLREPIRGRGGQWYEQHKEDPSMGIDSLPLNKLMKNYGQRNAERGANETQKPLTDE